MIPPSASCPPASTPGAAEGSGLIFLLGPPVLGEDLSLYLIVPTVTLLIRSIHSKSRIDTRLLAQVRLGVLQRW